MSCPEKSKPGGCQLPNVHCGFPECDKPRRLKTAWPFRVTATTQPKEKDMPRRIICDFSEVPVGQLFKSEEDDNVYYKQDHNHAYLVFDEANNGYPDPTEDPFGTDMMNEFSPSDEVEYPPSPQLMEDALSGVRDRAEAMKDELKFLHMILGDEEWARIFRADPAPDARMPTENGG